MESTRNIVEGIELDPSRYVVKVTLTSGLVGLAFFALAVGFTWWMFAPHVPGALMKPWLYASCAFLLFWLVLDIIMLIRRPSDRELITVWAKLALFIRVASNIVVLTTIWLFLPHAPRELQLVMTIFYTAHVPTQVLTQPGNALINGAGALVVLGSAVAVNLIYGGAYSGMLAAFLAAFALAMFSLSRVVGQLITSAMKAQRQSEESALELEKALAQVSTERDAKTRFMSAASHDLGQPLQAASLFFDQVMMARDESGRATAAQGVRRAFGSAEQLLSHMLNHLRLESDRVEPIRVRTPLGPLLQRVTDQFAPAAREAGLRIRLVRTERVMIADPSLLERALGNLIGNAITHSGGTRLLVGVQARGGRLCIRVIDDGAGISRMDAVHVFNDYFQGAASHTKIRTGFGLGLASVKRIAELLGGDAGLDPGWTKGAAFFLDFPDEGLPARSRQHEMPALDRRKELQ